MDELNNHDVSVIGVVKDCILGMGTYQKDNHITYLKLNDM